MVNNLFLDGYLMLNNWWTDGWSMVDEGELINNKLVNDQSVDKCFINGLW